MEWVEATGKSVELAVEAAIAELGIDSRESAVVEVIQEPKAGFLGFGGQEAIVKVTPKPGGRKRRRGRGRGRGDEADDGREGSRSQDGGGRDGRGRRDRGQSGGGRTEERPPASTAKAKDGPDDRRRGSGAESRGEGAKSDRAGGGRGEHRPPRSGDRDSRNDQQGKANGKRQVSDGRQGNRKSRSGAGATEGAQNQDEGHGVSGSEAEASIEQQADVAATFIRGLLEAYGLDGQVVTEIDGNILKIDVSGDQTEALVGAKGIVLQSVLEITRTVIQRHTFGAPRMRLDIAGYNERRRQALTIYAGKLAEKVIADGGEVMLEPMNAADRKVVHDAVGEIDGVRSFSEGEDPDRSVVITTLD